MTTQRAENNRVLVIGSGAIGGTIASHLTHAGVETWALVTNPHIRAALRAHGFRCVGYTQLRHVAAKHVVGDASELPGSFDFALLAVPPPEVETAVASVRDALGERGRFICFQNGLCEPRVGKLVGDDRVIGGVIAWGASMPEPGVFDRTSAGGFTLGKLDGSTDLPLQQIAALLRSVAPVTFTDNLLGARWSKLAINCAVSTLGTIGGQRVGTLLRSGLFRRLALEIVTEATEVAAATGVRLEKVSTTFDVRQLALTEHETRNALHPALWWKHGLLLAIGQRYRRMRSSMLRAIERGRAPAVDFLNGEVVEHGRRVGISTPRNEQAQDMVWKIARGEMRPGWDAGRLLYRESV